MVKQYVVQTANPAKTEAVWASPKHATDQYGCTWVFVLPDTVINTEKEEGENKVCMLSHPLLTTACSAVAPQPLINIVCTADAAKQNDLHTNAAQCHSLQRAQWACVVPQKGITK